MAYNFKNLADVELLEKVPEEATAFVELNGSIKRVPSKGLGGEGGIKTAIIKDSGYDDALYGVSNPKVAPGYTYECLNMTFEEAYAAMESGEPVACFGMFTLDRPSNLYGLMTFYGIRYDNTPCITLEFISEYMTINLVWTADELYQGILGGGES